MWLIAKTDPKKEFAVAQAISELGHAVWVPTQISVKRKSVSVGPGITLRRREPDPRPLIPSVLFVARPTHHDAFPVLRYLQGFWTDCFEVARTVPESQLAVFRARVEEENAREIARIKKSQLGRRKSKRTVRLGDPSLADQLKEILFGAEQQEAA